LCQPRVIVKMIVEKQMECRLAGETEVLGENLPQRHFCPSKSHMIRPGFEPGPPRWENAMNLLSGILFSNLGLINDYPVCTIAFCHFLLTPLFVHISLSNNSVAISISALPF
jgi:hypothetical protein